MKWTSLLCWLAIVALPEIVLAQQWTVYSPPERDFRAVFPAPPSRVDAANGATAFTASAEGIEFTVYRRDPRREPLENVVGGMQRRLQADSEEQQVRRAGADDFDDKDALQAEHVFRTGNRWSVHRIVVSQGRYYELMMRTSRENFGDARHVARDFFGSFQAGAGALFPGGAIAGIAPDAACKGRSNVFSRTFCEYRTCFQPGYEKHPYCTKLLPW